MATSSSTVTLAARRAAGGRPTGDRAAGGRRRGRTPAGPGRRRRCRRRGRAVDASQITVVWRQRTPGSSARWTPWRTEKWSADARGIRRSPASEPAVGPVTNPPGWAARQDGAALLERRAAPRRSTNTPLRRRAAARRRSSRRSIVARPTLVRAQTRGGDDAVVGGEPRAGERREVGHRGPPRIEVTEGDVGAVDRTPGVRARHRSVWCGRSPQPNTPMAPKHSDGVRCGGGSGIRRGRRGRSRNRPMAVAHRTMRPQLCSASSCSEPDMPLLSLGSYCDGGDDEEDARDQRTRPSGRRSRTGRSPRSPSPAVLDGGAIRFMNDACTTWWYTWYTASADQHEPDGADEQPPGRQVEQRRRRLLLLLVAGVLRPRV